jgi:hypothetical protein
VIDGLSALVPEVDAATAPAAGLTTESLAVLPADLLEKLRSATASADMDALEQHIDRVAEIDAGVAARLRKLVDDYDYDRISELLGS